jgi:hypothetical protein
MRIMLQIKIFKKKKKKTRGEKERKIGETTMHVG